MGVCKGHNRGYIGFFYEDLWRFQGFFPKLGLPSWGSL